MKWRFLLPAALLLIIAALLFFLFFDSSADLPLPLIEKQISSVAKTSQLKSVRGISNDTARPDLDLPSRIQGLFDELPKLNAREQEKCAEEIADLSDDSTAVKWSTKLISDSIPLAAARTLFNDLLNRPPEVLQPFLAEIADKFEHPLKEECTAALEFLYEGPPTGNNWTRRVKLKLTEK